MAFYPSTDKGIATDAPVRRRVGHEIELSGDPALARWLTESGLAPPSLYESEHPEWMDDEDFIHYDCHNLDCEADDFPIHVTEDYTAPAGEYHIGGKAGVLYGSPAYYEAVDILCREAPRYDVTARDDDVGGHIHVSVASWETGQRARQLARQYAEELEVLAQGDLGYMRCNEYMDGIHSPAGMRSNQHYSTVEFRFWNSTLNPELIVMGGGISVGLIEAASRGRTPRGELLDLIGPYITDRVRSTASNLLAGELPVAA